MRYFLGIVLPFLIFSVCQAEIVTVTVNSAEVLTDASKLGTFVVLEAPKFYPLSVKGERDDYYQVRDYLGRKGWVEKSLVGDTKGVVIEVYRANIRKGPGTDHPIVFRALRGVAFKVLREKDGWLEVQHESGKTGWVSRPLTWGQ